MSSDSSSAFSVLSVPLYFWDLYVEHLWNYKPGTWVYRIASTCWILAFIVATPFVFLTLLDVASYVIARTLGVVESTKASTGEMPANPVPAPAATTQVQDDGTLQSSTINLDDDVPSIHVVDPTPPVSASVSLDTTAEHESTSYLRDTVVEEGNPKLSGVDAFSPAPSQPPSPTISRRDLSGGSVGRFNGLAMTSTEMKGEMRRKRSDSETSGEEGSGVQMRRRVRDRREGDE